MLEKLYEDDIVIKCKECGEDFIFTKREQEFYKEKGWDSEPKSCYQCRKNRKKYIRRED
ncbi:zinc-ribbon domain-containing protein [Clostridium sp. UBA7791]|uniref:zinc-ribbon domain-containing protein n=1 Tax=Clostridium sp. UBA7791 TaxID=1946379 RepID=UPI003216848E